MTSGVKIRQSTVTPSGSTETVQYLMPGDTIEYAITHEVNADGEKMWVKMGFTSSVREGESSDEAIARVTNHCHTEVLKAAERAVDSVKAL